MRFTVRNKLNVVFVGNVRNENGICRNAVFVEIDRSAADFPAVKHFVCRGYGLRRSCFTSASYGVVGKRGILVFEDDRIQFRKLRRERRILRNGISAHIHNGIAVERPTVELVSCFGRRSRNRRNAVFKNNHVMVVFIFDNEIYLILVCNVGNDFRVLRNAVCRKVDCFAVHRPAVKDFIRRRFRRRNRKQTVFVYHLHIVNAAVKFKCGDDLFTALQRSKILFVITDRFLQFGNLGIERTHHSRIVLRLQCKVGNLTIERSNLRVQPVYSLYVQFVVRL